MNDDLRQLLERFGLAVALGLLVGLQRQHAASLTAGVRTFPILTVFGLLASLLDRQLDAHGWIVAAGLLTVGMLVGMSHLYQLRSAAPDQGLTTEVASILMFAVGAYLLEGYLLFAIVLVAGLAGLLQFKGELHGLIRQLGPDDVRAIITFALISGVVWPVLPDKAYGPFEILNPFDMWRMVVLMVGISLSGYLIYKFCGERSGLLLGGILGGAISSTATTFNYARRTREASELAWPATLIILIASTVVFFRLIVEIAVAAPSHFVVLTVPLVVLLGVGIVTSSICWLRIRGEEVAISQHANPTELTSALLFAALYAGILFALAAAKHHAHTVGIYATAVMSGLTDMDAITLSTASLVERGVSQGGLEPSEGWRLIVIAALANLCFKLVIVAAVGGRGLWQKTALLFSPYFVAMAALLVMYP